MKGECGRIPFFRVANQMQAPLQRKSVVPGGRNNVPSQHKNMEKKTQIMGKRI